MTTFYILTIVTFTFIGAKIGYNFATDKGYHRITFEDNKAVIHFRSEKECNEVMQYVTEGVYVRAPKMKDIS